MRIQIDGTNTLNKGAELMLYAIIEQIEKIWPSATVYYNSNDFGGKKLELNTDVQVKQRFFLKYGRYPNAVMSRLKLPCTIFTHKYVKKHIDVVLDGSGFQFSDQWNYSHERLNEVERYYRKLKKNGVKVILLPQAFGPFKTKEGKRMVSIINRYVDIVIAREKISYQYLFDAGVEQNKVWQYPDFTILVNGILPEKYNFIKGRACIIPNKKMITHTKSGSTEYVDFMENIIKEVEDLGKKVFLLNHEGKGDLELCRIINSKFKNKLELISGLNAREIKGVIGASNMVISSRFHGVVSALNQEVPCLATSWNHKYQMLFEDFDQKDKVLDVEEDWQVNEKKIQNIFQSYQDVKRGLEMKKKEMSLKINNMWDNLAKVIQE